MNTSETEKLVIHAYGSQYHIATASNEKPYHCICRGEFLIRDTYKNIYVKVPAGTEFVVHMQNEVKAKIYNNTTHTWDDIMALLTLYRAPDFDGDVMIGTIDTQTPDFDDNIMQAVIPQ